MAFIIASRLLSVSPCCRVLAACTGSWLTPRATVLGRVNDAVAEQFEPGAPVYLPFQELQPMHLAFRLPIAPWFREPCAYGVKITPESSREAS